MQLSRVEIKNFRSIFDMGDGSTSLDLCDGLNLFVGKNNCGKSNVLRAVAMAMDPEYQFSAPLDVPAQRSKVAPSVTLEFDVGDKTSGERSLLKYADEYELSIRKPKTGTLASEGKVTIQVHYHGPFDAMTRTERVVTKAGGQQGPPELREKVLRQLRKISHFVLLESGQSIEAMLEGKFREILNSVIRDHLKDELDQAREHRLEYVRKLQEELLAPLRDQVQDQLTSVFPEMTATSLMPQVSEVEAALAEVTVQLTDSVTGPLVNKGTGVRGGVLLAMLRYLAAQSRRSMVFAVEEPEAFLHPAAQRALASDLVDLARQRNVTLLATSHSPFMVPRNEHIKVVSLDKDPTGSTKVIGVGHGSGPAAELLVPLFGDLTSAAIFERTTDFDDSVRGVVLVEGITDKLFLEAAAQATDTAHLLEGLRIEPVDGTTNLLARYGQLATAARCPIVVLLDSDANGEKAKSSLESHMRLFSDRHITMYGRFFGSDQEFDWEAEDLFPARTVERAVEANGGEHLLTGKRRRPDQAWHYDIHNSHKLKVAEWLINNASSEDFALWVKVLERLDGSIQAQITSRLKEAEGRARAAAKALDESHPPTAESRTVDSPPATEGVSGAILALMQSSPGKVWTRNEIVEATGFKPTSVASFLSDWTNPKRPDRHRPEITRVGRGKYAYRFSN